MENRRTMRMNWDDLGADASATVDAAHFFESLDRISVSSAAPIALAASSSSDEDEDRVSFASAQSGDLRRSYASVDDAVISGAGEYDFWAADPGSIKERRLRLLQGMGLSGDQELLTIPSNGFPRAAANHVDNDGALPSAVAVASSPRREPKQEPSPSSPSASSSPFRSCIAFARSRSEGDIGANSIEIERRRRFIGEISKQRLTRTLSTSTPCARSCRLRANLIRKERNGGSESSSAGKRSGGGALCDDRFGAFFLIKNLDTGEEFVVNEYDQHGMWNRLSDIQTGKQLTMEEFEKSLGYSPVVKELLRRENISRNPENAAGGGGGGERKVAAAAAVAANSYLGKSFRYSKRRGVALLKNIKEVANSMSGLIADKERDHHHSPAEQRSNKSGSPSSRWTKVRQYGKSLKELTALHLCQEIQAHDGSIWAARFSLDGRYLATAGEDRVIHVWEVQECEIMQMRCTDEFCTTSPNRQFSETEKEKGKNSKGNTIPDYVHAPETVFSLAEKPACSLKGHLDDVLDLSWSKSQLLLSSSMDKTVRLWDTETKCCLKLFAHNDYVTCIQFNPADDNYFISGSLDAKVRIWSIHDRQVVDWNDLHEMVTAACYTPDGQGALVGTHKGNCRSYSIADCKLSPKNHFDIHQKKKSQEKKITGFQFAPGSNSSEVLITSADSRIRIFDGSDMARFRNTSSQISASFTHDGKYIVCASEDSHVYVWKQQEEPRNGSSAGNGRNKGYINIRSHEHFQCRDVSAAIPWPGTVKGDPPPPMVIHSKRHSKRSSAAAAAASVQPDGSPATWEEEYASGRHHSKRGNLPPLPRKIAAIVEKPSTGHEEEISGSARVDSGIESSGESFGSAPASSRYGESSSISESWSASWSFFDVGSSQRNHHTAGAPATAPTAWGMVIVTASLGGEIRAFQNFGLPVRIRRQSNLFNGT